MAGQHAYRVLAGFVACFVLIGVQACNKAKTSNSNAQAGPENSNTQVAEQPAAPIDPDVFEKLRSEKWTGDLDGLRKRRYIRALVLYNKTNSFMTGRSHEA